MRIGLEVCIVFERQAEIYDLETGERRSRSTISTLRFIASMTNREPERFDGFKTTTSCFPSSKYRFPDFTMVVMSTLT
jgi:hypothetical protein